MASFTVPIRKHLLGLKPYVPGKPLEELERELGIHNASKLASNENPIGPSPLVLTALEKALPKIHRYPDGGAYSLSQALSRHLKISPEQLLLGHGSNELIVRLGQMVLEKGDEALFGDPGFFVYGSTAQMCEAVSRAIPLKNFIHDLVDFEKALGPKTRIVYIANPNNPTGTMVPLAQVEGFLKVCPPNVLVVLDEAYYEYVEDPVYFESVGLLSKYPNLVILRTFSKAFGLAGLRVGYGVGHPDLAAAFQKFREPFNVNGLAMVAAEAALGDMAHVQKVAKLNSAMRAKLREGLMGMGFQVPATQTNFVYFKAPGAVELYDRLLRKGIIVRPMGPEALRVNTGTEEETANFLKAFGEIRTAVRA